MNKQLLKYMKTMISLNLFPCLWLGKVFMLFSSSKCHLTNDHSPIYICIFRSSFSQMAVFRNSKIILALLPDGYSSLENSKNIRKHKAMDREGNCSMQRINKEIFLNALTHALCLLQGGLVQE